MKEGEAGELRIANCGFVPGSPAGELRIANFELRIWAQLAVSKRFFKLHPQFAIRNPQLLVCRGIRPTP